MGRNLSNIFVGFLENLSKGIFEAIEQILPKTFFNKSTPSCFLGLLRRVFGL
jgi:hypothetical protein